MQAQASCTTSRASQGESRAVTAAWSWHCHWCTWSRATCHCVCRVTRAVEAVLRTQLWVWSAHARLGDEW